MLKSRFPHPILVTEFLCDLYSIKACRSMTSVMCKFDSERDCFPHIDKTEAGELFFYMLKFIFPVESEFSRRR